MRYCCCRQEIITCLVVLGILAASLMLEECPVLINVTMVPYFLLLSIKVFHGVFMAYFSFFYSAVHLSWSIAFDSEIPFMLCILSMDHGSYITPRRHQENPVETSDFDSVNQNHITDNRCTVL